jgi:hypothetical protein
VDTLRFDRLNIVCSDQSTITRQQLAFAVVIDEKEQHLVIDEKEQHLEALIILAKCSVLPNEFARILSSRYQI